jgi:predicted acyl esterase
MKKIIIMIILILFISPVFSATKIDLEISNNNHMEEEQDFHNEYYRPLFFGKTYMVEMRDGVKLATDVYKPILRFLPHGTILIRTPYNKDELKILGVTFSILGWPTVIQDMRGRYASEGNDTVYQNSHTDGPDTLSWIANQRWSNGKVVTAGPSALGINQYFMAGANPENLAGQFIMVATPNLHKHAIFQGGQFRKALVEGWLEDQGSSYVLEQIFDNENYSMDFWTNVSLEDNWQYINIPAVHLGGWYDIFLQGIIDGYLGYQNLGGPGAQGKSKLIMGPWTHDGYIERNQGELFYPRNSLGWWALRMFRDLLIQYTMAESTCFDNWPTVIYYVMGDVEDTNAPGNEWRYSDSWPIPAVQREWYLHEGGLLSTEVSGNYNSISYSYNPINPVPTIGGQNLNIERGPFDQRNVEDRDDVIIFTSNVLTEPYEATGPIKARLYVSSNCSDTDFTVKLTDVYPDGRSMLITDGILRMRNRNGTDHWELIQAGEIYEIEVDLWSTSYIWNIGHRIRIAISSSNYPRFLNNPNTIDGIYKNSTYKIANNTLYLDINHPSCIILPEIEQSYNKLIINGFNTLSQIFLEKITKKLL